MFLSERTGSLKVSNRNESVSMSTIKHLLSLKPTRKDSVPAAVTSAIEANKLAKDSANIKGKRPVGYEKCPDENTPPRLTSNGSPYKKRPPSLLRQPKPAALVLQDMMTEVNATRRSMPSLLDSKKLGQDIKSHHCYQQWIGGDMEYAEILNTKIEAKKTEQGKQVAQQRTLILKLKQAIGDLLTKRDQFLVAVCEREEGFQHRETASKDQVTALQEQLRAVISSSEERQAGAEECFKRSLEALLQEKEGLQRQLDAGRQNLEFDHTELEGARAHLEHTVVRVKEANEQALLEKARSESLQSDLAAAQAEIRDLKAAADRKLREEHDTLAGASELSNRLQRALDDAAADKERLISELNAKIALEIAARAEAESNLRTTHAEALAAARADGDAREAALAARYTADLAARQAAAAAAGQEVEVLRARLEDTSRELEMVYHKDMQACTDEASQLAEMRQVNKEQEQRIAAQEITLWKLRDEKQRELAGKQGEIDDLEKRLSEARSEISEAKRIRSDQEAELRRAAAAEADLRAAAAAAEAAAARLEAAEAEAAGLRARLAETEAKRDELLAAVGSDLQASQMSKTQLDEALRAAHTQLEAQTQQLQAAQATITALTADKESLNKQLLEFSDKFIAEQQRSVTEVTKERETAAAAKASYEERLGLLDTQLREANTSLAVLNSQVVGIREELERKERDKESLNKEAAKLSVERDMLSLKLAEMDKRLEEKEGQVRDAMRTVAQTQEMQIGRSRELIEERDRLLDDLARKKDDTKHIKYEVDKLKAALHDSELKHQDLQVNLTNAKIALDANKAALEQTQEMLNEAQRGKASAHEKLAVVEAEYRTFKQCCNSPNNIADQLHELLALEATKASALSRIAAAEEEAESQKALVVKLRDQVTSLQQRLVAADTLRRRLHNELQEMKGNIRVFARVRPSEERCALVVDEEAGTVGVPYNGSNSLFKCDRIFSPRATQEDVFGEVSSFIQSALDGYNVSLFAYGQTGSGKTHTMFGTGNDLGIIPRSIALILATIDAQAESGWEYKLEASFLEIYQEHIRDLLCSDKDRDSRQYKITQGENGRHDVSDLTYQGVHTQEDVKAMMALAESNRTIARTDMNERSSRSHTIFTLRISGTRTAGGQTQTLHGTLHLVDLAGSERLAKSNATGERMKEAQAINKSLSALSDVFVALSRKAGHVPYRNSRLTFLLQPCLSGDGKALVIANLSPIEASAHESLCTLRFAGMVGSCELGKATKNLSTVTQQSSRDSDDGSVCGGGGPGLHPEGSFASAGADLSERSTASVTSLSTATLTSLRAPSPSHTPRRIPAGPTTPSRAAASAGRPPVSTPGSASRSAAAAPRSAHGKPPAAAAGSASEDESELCPADVDLDM